MFRADFRPIDTGTFYISKPFANFIIVVAFYIDHKKQIIIIFLTIIPSQNVLTLKSTFILHLLQSTLCLFEQIQFANVNRYRCAHCNNA